MEVRFYKVPCLALDISSEGCQSYLSTCLAYLWGQVMKTLEVWNWDLTVCSCRHSQSSA